MKNDSSFFRQGYQNDMVHVEDSLSQCMKDAKVEVLEGQRQLKDHIGLMITTGFERSKVGLATEEKKRPERKCYVREIEQKPIAVAGLCL